MNKYDRQSKTRTRVQIEREGRTGEAGLSTLSPMEEKLIRMVHGLGEGDDTPLEFAVGASEDARLRLALMEAYNVAELEGGVPLGKASPDQQAHLDAIVARYRDDER